MEKDKVNENEKHHKENDSDPFSSQTDILWTNEHEKILVEWADKAMCYRWLHNRAYLLYSRLNAWYTIPVIIISTLTGTANFAQTRVPIEYQNYFAMGVGAFNILGGIITTIQQFLKITQLNESHRVSGISWDKFYRNIKVELAKHPDERIHVDHMIKICKEEYDRLMETSPTIPEKIIKQFNIAFHNDVEFDAIKKPEICDVLVSTEKSKNPWNSEENIEKRRLEEATSVQLKSKKEKVLKEHNEKLLKDFKESFFKMNYRDPLYDEIIDNLKDMVGLDELNKIIQDSDNTDNASFVAGSV
jgi:hypothetical protein